MEKAELPRAESPWDVTGIGWTALIKTPFSIATIPLPSGAYHPLESGTSADMSSRFHGGVGAIMLVRYDSSPVGPYDELLYIPGLFSRGEGNSLVYYYSITRIWVSTEASVVNGRSNWGIPKHLAKFSFTPTTSLSKSPIFVTVSPFSSTELSSTSIPDVSTPTQPFFKVILTTSKYIPSFQVRTIWFANAVAVEFFGLPNQTFLQPKLPSASIENLSELTDVQKASIQNENPESLVGTTLNYLVNLRASGMTRICYWKAVDDEDQEEKFSAFGDGISFPKFSIYLGRGTMMKFDMRFWEPEPSGFNL